LSVTVDLEVNFKQKYDIINDRKEVLSTKFPTIHLGMEKGMHDMEYLKGFININHQFDIGVLGQSLYSVTHGRFLKKRRISVLDYFHFNANQYIVLQPRKSLGLSYQLLDFYNFSTPSYFTGLNYAHYFKGALMKRLPVLKHTGIQSVVNFNYLTTIERSNYLEFGFGVEHRILPIRMDYYWAYLESQFYANGLRVNYNFGTR
jgi:hypothetical protein